MGRRAIVQGLAGLTPALACGLIGAWCGCTAVEVPADATVETAVNDARSAEADLGGPVRSVDLGWDYLWPDMVLLPPSMDAMPPAILCGRDAGGLDLSAGCAPPPSSCADDHWLLYFTNGRCEQGLCHFDVQYLDCSQGPQPTCFDGACQYNQTL